MEILEMAVDEQLVGYSKEELLELASEIGITAEMEYWQRPKIMKEVHDGILRTTQKMKMKNSWTT